MNQPSTMTRLNRDEIVIALASLGEDPSASRVDALHAWIDASIDASSLPDGERSEVVRDAVDAARTRVDALAPTERKMDYFQAQRMIDAAVTKVRGAEVGAYLTVDHPDADVGFRFVMVGPDGATNRLLASQTHQDRLDAHWGGFVHEYAIDGDRNVRGSMPDSKLPEATSGEGASLTSYCQQVCGGGECGTGPVCKYGVDPLTEMPAFGNHLGIAQEGLELSIAEHAGQMVATMKLPQNVPNAVKAAFDHVKSLYPEVTQVAYGGDQKWLYMDSAGNAPVFDGAVGDVDVGVLEDAADRLDVFPVTFALNEAGALEVESGEREMLESRNDIANRALKAYDFGDGVQIDETDDNWKYTTSGDDWTMALFVTNGQYDDDVVPPARCLTRLAFVVRFNPADGSLDKVHAIDWAEKVWGHLPIGKWQDLERKLPEHRVTEAEVRADQDSLQRSAVASAVALKEPTPSPEM